MHGTANTSEIIAAAAAALALIALIWALSLSLALRRLRAAQRTVLGDGEADLVAHAAHLQASFESLAQYVEDFGTRLDARMDHAELRLDGSIAHRALVRYDAYGEMSGRQSTSLALLDANRSGVVLSTIHHREHARLYAKQLHQGSSDLELSPEEAQAVALALSGDTGEAAVAAAARQIGARGAGVGTGRRTPPDAGAPAGPTPGHDLDPS